MSLLHLFWKDGGNTRFENTKSVRVSWAGVGFERRELAYFYPWRIVEACLLDGESIQVEIPPEEQPIRKVRPGPMTLKACLRCARNR